MNCPYCDGGSRVIDSRPIPDGVRRRRECDDCHRRFTTYERAAPPEIRVVKTRDHRGEAFDREKLVRTVLRVGKGLTVSATDAERIAREVEAELLDHDRHVVAAGELVLALLQRLEKLHRRAFERLQANYLDSEGNLVLDTRLAEGDGVDQGVLFETERPET